MNDSAVILAGLLCLVAVVGYGVSLGTTQWLITTLGIGTIKLGGVSSSKGLFDVECSNVLELHCWTFDVYRFLQNGDVASKVAAAGVILAGLSSITASIILFCSTCNKNSSSAKTGGAFGIFAVLLAVGGIATFVALNLQKQTTFSSIPFGYSLYIASAAGGADLLAAVAACAGA